MGRFVVGIVGNFNLINDEYPAYAAGKMNCDALSKVSNVIPIIVPSSPEFTTVDELISMCDGFCLLAEDLTYIRVIMVSRQR